MMQPSDEEPQRLGRAFFARPAPEVARAILGQRLVRILPDGTRLSGRVVEAEAYHGAEDSASHARAGETPRTRLMFGPAGRSYIYLIYGMYHMLNVTTDQSGIPSAVLIRALEPEEGIERMVALREGRRRHLTNGPGRLCRALNITGTLNGLYLDQSDALWFEHGMTLPEDEVARGPRIGINYAAPEHQRLPWRLYHKDNPWTTR